MRIITIDIERGVFMFKKLFAILLALLMLCSCATEETPEPVLPEENEKEEEIVTSADESGEEEENPKIEEAEAKRFYESGDHEIFISRINQRIESYKNGTFEEMPNHHPAYPEDFPPVENLPEATEKNVLLGWKNTEQLSENSWSDGYVEYVYIIDENHAIILEPAVLIIEEEAILALVNTGYLNENVESWAKECFDGFFGGSFGPEEAETEVLKVEPELIAEHIAALNEAAREFFGAECVQNMYYSFYFKEENTDWNTVPDMVSEEYLGDSTEEYYYDYFERTVMEVTNFKTKSEVREYMSRWLDSSLFEADYCGIDFNFMEFEGKLYLLRGNRGYGLVSYGNSEITSKTADKMTAKAYIYQNNVYEAGTAEIKFEKIDGNWIIVSVEDNYY